MRIARLKANIVSVTFCLCLSVVGSVTPLASSSLAATNYAQTPSRTMNGIEVSGRFLEVWSKQGNERDSLYVNGLPITPRRSEVSMDDGKLYDTQWFERARYELHVENPAPYDVLLGRLGASRAEGRGKMAPGTSRAASPGDEPFIGVSQPPPTDKSRMWFAETRHTLSGKLLEYWQRYGGIAQFGYPLSEPFQEVSQADGKLYTVQYFERNRMELHPEKPAPYDVELGLLGVEQVGVRAVPSGDLPVSPPRDITTVRDEVRIGMSQEPGTLTFNNNTPAAIRIRSLIEDQMVGRDDNDNLFPLNAWYVPTLENGGASFLGTGDDRYLKVKYKLRRGIKWNDGVELTSNDAVFAYKLAMNPETYVEERAEYQKLQNVDNPDRYTVIYNYRSLNQAASFLKSVPNTQDYGHIGLFAALRKPVVSRAYSEIGAVYPEHVLGKIPLSRIADNPIARAPIGTGPYKVEKWTTRQEMVLVPNEHYTLTSAPLIKRITIKFDAVPGSLASRIMTGDVDLVTSESYTSPPANAAELKSKGVTVATRPAAVWERIEFYTLFGPFKERAVREAIATSINRQRIVDSIYGGAAAVMNGPAPPSLYYSLENPNFVGAYPGVAAKYKLPVYAYDPERAKKLLDDAGWKTGPDGVRAKGGEKLSFIYGAFISSARQQIQTLVTADLKAVGVEAVQKSYPAGCMDCPSVWSDGTMKLRQGASTSTRRSDFGEWVCERIPDPAMDPNTQKYIVEENAYRLCDPNVKAANDKFKSEASLSVQVEAAAQAQALLMQNVSLIPLVQRPNIELVTNKLVNHKLPNSTNSSFWNARQWYFR